MDNVCHTLVGAACARAGLARPTRFAAATSMIAANLPDVDVLVFATEVPSVAFRRGWTHGVLAQAALPALLALVIVAIGRRFPRQVTHTGCAEPAIGPLLVLSYVGVLSHVFLDLLNNYGVRLLMPFSGRWFYGDALFILDPWLWGLFGAAVVLGRGGRVRRARTCLIVAGVYIVCMIGSARAARQIVLDSWRATAGSAPQAWMVGPAPVNPFRKAVIIDVDDRYRTGTFTWFPLRTGLTDAPVMKNDDHPAIAVARRDARIAGILVWARFPFWELGTTAGGTRVTVRDMRFAGLRRGGFSATAVVPEVRRGALPYRWASTPGLKPGPTARDVQAAPDRRRSVRGDCRPRRTGTARAPDMNRTGPDVRRPPGPAACRARRRDTGSTVPSARRRLS